MSAKLLILILTLSFLSFQETFVLKIEISELKNSEGQVLLELSDAEKNVIKGLLKEIDNNNCTFTINDLAPGKYTFKYFHDENNNKKIDSNWLKIPKEGYGFSNNAKGTFGPPSHEKMSFELTRDTILNCTPMYIKN